jgi:catechol 2,3-dioxygenase-like lactoylglutathione lyase family enzyme
VQRCGLAELVGKEHTVLLDGINHVAWISRDVARLGRFYAEVFEAEVGPTRPHGQDPGETMTVIRIGPHTELNIVTIDGNTEPDRQTPMWGRGRIDHLGLHAASPDAFATIRQRLIDAGASDGTVNDFGGVLSMFFRDPDGLEGEVLVPKS